MPNNSTAHFTVINMPDLPERMATRNFQLTERSKKLFDLGKPGQGYIGILDLNTFEIDLIPAFNKEDGLIVADKNGGHFQIDGEEKKWIVKSAAKLGKVAGDAHTKALELLHKENFSGMILGFGIWKAGCGIKFLSELPQETGQVRHEYYVSKQEGKWRLYFLNMNAYKPMEIEAAWFDQAANQFPDKKPEDMTQKERENIEKLIAKHFAENYFIDLQTIKAWKNRSTSQNTFTIHYSKFYQAWFLKEIDQPTVHLINVQREIPRFIFQEIVNTIAKELQPQMKDVDVLWDDAIPDGPSGIKLHFLQDYDYIGDTKKEIKYLISELLSSQALKDREILKDLLAEREDLKKSNLFVCHSLPRDEELKKSNYQYAYFFVKGTEQCLPQIYYVKNGKKSRLDISKEAEHELKKALEQEEMAVTEVPLPRQYRLSSQMLNELWKIIATDKKHSYFKEPEPFIYYLDSLPEESLLNQDCYQNAYLFTKEPCALFYIRNGKKEELICDEAHVRSALNHLDVEDSKSQHPLPLQKKYPHQQESLSQLWQEICKNNGHIYLLKMMSLPQLIHFNYIENGMQKLEEIFKNHRKEFIALPQNKKYKTLKKVLEIKPFNKNLLMFLLDKLHCDINVTNNEGQTILMNSRVDSAVILDLLALGANPLQKDHYGRNALHYALENKNSDIAKLLINVIDEKNIDIASKDQTPLMLACLLGEIEIIQLLLAKGANPFNKDKDGYTSFHLAFEQHNDEISKLLIPYLGEKDIDMKTSSERTMLMLACESGSAEVVAMLLAKGANPLLKDCKDRVALHYAVRGHIEIVDLLIKQIDDENIDTADQDGHTPLMIACRRDEIEIIKLLLDKGANPFLRDRDGWTAFSYVSDAKVFVLLQDAQKIIANDNENTPYFNLFNDALAKLKKKYRENIWKEQSNLFYIIINFCKYVHQHATEDRFIILKNWVNDYLGKNGKNPLRLLQFNPSTPKPSMGFFAQHTKQNDFLKLFNLFLTGKKKYCEEIESLTAEGLSLGFSK